MRVLHLFAGMGGSHLAAKLIPEWTESAGSVEINKACRAVLSTHFPADKLHDDVVTFKGHGLAVDVCIMGFPCTDLSTAGLRRGIVEGTRSNLFFEGLRIAEETQAPLVFIENVRGLLSDRASFETALKALQSSGYGSIRWVVNKASDVGAPHLRQRVWLLARRTGAPDKITWVAPVKWPTKGILSGNDLALFPKIRHVPDKSIKYWPTPDASQMKITPTSNQMSVLTAFYEDENRTWVKGIRNPWITAEFVETLMGWPVGWTSGVPFSWEAWPAAKGLWPATRGLKPYAWEPRRDNPKGSNPQIRASLKALGNAWVPSQAALAWKQLTAPVAMKCTGIRHGIIFIHKKDINGYLVEYSYQKESKHYLGVRYMDQEKIHGLTGNLPVQAKESQLAG